MDDLNDQFNDNKVCLDQNSNFRQQQQQETVGGGSLTLSRLNNSIEQLIDVDDVDVVENTNDIGNYDEDYDDETNNKDNQINRQNSISLSSLSTSSSSSDIALIAELASALDLNVDLFKFHPDSNDHQLIDDSNYDNNHNHNNQNQNNNNQMIDDSNRNYLTKESLLKFLRNYLEKRKNLNLNGGNLEEDLAYNNNNIMMNDDGQQKREKIIDYNYDNDEQNTQEDKLNNEIKINDVKTMLIMSTNESDSIDLTDNKINETFGQDGSNNNNNNNNNTNLPRHLIVTSIPNDVFNNNELKAKFEKLFTDIDSRCKFCYFRIFKRCSIEFEDPIAAVLARIQLDDELFMNEKIKLFLNKPIKAKNSRPFLEPPKNDKTFLISPPSSPPVGWEQIYEDPPVVNLDLLAALSKLNPLEPCELIKSSEEMPGIIIHPCADLNEPFDSTMPRKFMPTRRPAYEFN